MRMKIADLFYFALPLLLWPVSFIFLRSIFIYALTVSTAILATLTLYRYRVNWTRTKSREKVVIAGLLGALLVYLIFVFGRIISNDLGLAPFISAVYSSIYGSHNSSLILAFLIGLIGIFEEVYWRGGVQGYIEVHSKIFKAAPWVASSIYYAFVHISTLNPILVLSSLLVGVVNGILAQRFGVLASAITHVAWIETIVVFLPV